MSASKEEIKAFIVETANAHFKGHGVEASLDNGTWRKWTRYVGGENPCKSLSALTEKVLQKFPINETPRNIETFHNLDEAAQYVSDHQK
jgi:hypothetical protein